MTLQSLELTIERIRLRSALLRRFFITCQVNFVDQWLFMLVGLLCIWLGFLFEHACSFFKVGLGNGCGHGHLSLDPGLNVAIIRLLTGSQTCTWN